MSYTIENGMVTFEEPIKVNKNYTIDSFDLNRISELQLVKNTKLNGIQLSDEYSMMQTKDSNNLKLDFEVIYEEEKLKMTGDVLSWAGTSIITVEETLDANVIIDKAVDILKTNPKIIDLSTINTLDVAVKSIKQKINDSAFENNILLAGEELEYRINLYDRNYSLVGVANRAHIIENFITLGEVILFDNKTNINNLNIEIVLNNETIIKIIDLEQNAVSGDSIKYCRYGTSRAKIKLETGEYDSNKMKLKGLKLPAIDASVMSLNEDLVSKNDVNLLVKAFKQNKRMNIVKIDINKYLLG
jgi:hypothetical protein